MADAPHSGAAQASSAAPALPWGRTGEPCAEPDAFESSLRKIMLSAALGKLEPDAKRARIAPWNDGTMEQLAAAERAEEVTADEPLPDDLAVGQRIEVKWQLEDGETITSTWWGASLLEQQAAAPVTESAAEAAPAVSAAESAVLATAAPQGQTWVLRYDAHGTFEQEDKHATLLTRHVLAHSDLEEPLAWRLEGEAYEPESDGEESEEEEEEARQRAYPVSAISDAIEQQMGCSVESAALQRMQASLPIEQQQTLAAGFNDFITHITGKLRQVAEAKDPRPEGGVVIMSEDVHAALASWKAEREAL